MEKLKKVKNTVKIVERLREFSILKAAVGSKPLEDFEYLIHHIETKGGKEEVHHCFLYDHIANLFEQAHLVIKDGKASLNGKAVKDATFHVIIGLEKTQEVAWTDKEAKEAKIKPKRMRAGMSLKRKAKEW